MYERFLESGYLPSLFWESTIGEVIDLINAYAKIKERERNDKRDELKTMALIAWNHVAWIGEAFSDKDSDNTIIDYFPGLFKEELEEIKEKKRIRDEQLHKAQMIELANRFRNKFKQEEHLNGNDS